MSALDAYELHQDAFDLWRQSIDPIPVLEDAYSDEECSPVEPIAYEAAA